MAGMSILKMYAQSLCTLVIPVAFHRELASIAEQHLCEF